ncbi:hypothetical protein Leryth_016811 [Lithospermum erythrorhizon]|nr:hypothetical protein Leryth_016811 [Lithospermum erythrorhizon]
MQFISTLFHEHDAPADEENRHHLIVIVSASGQMNLSGNRMIDPLKDICVRQMHQGLSSIY